LLACALQSLELLINHTCTLITQSFEFWQQNLAANRWAKVASNKKEKL